MKRFIIPVIAVLVIAGAALAEGCGASSDGGLTEAQQRNNDGVEADEAGRPEAAVALFTEAIELDPALVEAYVNRALALVALGRFDEALDDATNAIELEPGDVNLLARAYAIRSGTLGALGRFDESLDDATKAIELEPSDVNVLAQAYVNRSAALAVLGRFDESLDAATKAIELEPSDVNVLAQAYVNRSLALAELGRLDEAEADRAKACELGSKKACDLAP